MDWTAVVLIALAAAVLVVGAVWFAANRIDRLHRRVEKAWASLHLQLTRRASLALVLAHSGLWEPPVARTVETAARAALEAPPDGREHSELSAALRRAAGEPGDIERHLADPALAPGIEDLGAIWFRAILARRFLNDAISLTQRLRSRRLVRLFHLAGRAPMPLTCDIDDSPPEGLLPTSKHDAPGAH
jgi:hypothetical protein